MAKRLVRILPEKIADHFQGDQYLSFVSHDATVTLATPLSLKSDTLKVKNTKGHILHLPLAQLDEIWAEVKAE
ncbi:hypothetical protein [Marinoscillum sp. 108]|jgi:hypothetical protein|uniref:hypothetical protein n=1 Tax=Marinoscillum sp. 108 TaxID=2653151 RepID=UPI0012F11869|nr:hypothetical protein [Marinoscillum sp. 108]VXD21519.1 conserved hypothetical protein [Marinoscillum sp. 108]